MESQISRLETWKKLITSDLNDETMEELASLLEHLSLQTVPRLSAVYQACTLKTIEILGNLIDKIELSNKKTLCIALKLFKSFGDLRIAQITYFIGIISEDLENLYRPQIDKTKWYYMCPLLPEAGTIGWKSLLTHCMVKEEPALFAASLQLLLQKLFFCFNLNSLQGFNDQKLRITKSAKRASEKLIEICRDSAYDNQLPIDLNLFVVRLLLEYSEDYEVVVDAIIQDIFKPQFLCQEAKKADIAKLEDVIRQRIICKAQTQQLFIYQIASHLKINLIRRKRRSSSEHDAASNGKNLEEVLGEFIDRKTYRQEMLETNFIEIPSKYLQLSYLEYWLNILTKSITGVTLTLESSTCLLVTCSLILCNALTIIPIHMFEKIINLMITSIVNTSSVPTLFTIFNPASFAILTEKFAKVSGLVAASSFTLHKLYRTFFRGLRPMLLDGGEKSRNEISAFLDYACGKKLEKDLSNVICCVMISEFHGFLLLERVLKDKDLAAFCSYSVKRCNKRVQRLIRRHTCFKTEKYQINGFDESMEIEEANMSITGDTTKTRLALMVLVNIIDLSLRQKDDDLLDEYSGFIVNVYNFVEARIQAMVKEFRTSGRITPDPVDIHLDILLKIYVRHKKRIVPFFAKDLIGVITAIFIDPDIDQVDEVKQKKLKRSSKKIYKALKASVEIMASAGKTDCFNNIINQQYSQVVEPIVVATTEARKEKGCNSFVEINRNIGYFVDILFSHCKNEDYVKVCDTTFYFLERCDPLDHNELVYLIMLLNALIPGREHGAASPRCTHYESKLSIIACNFIRIIKDLEQGPSIHSYKSVGSHKSSWTIQCCTNSACINLYAKLCYKFQPNSTNTFMTDATQIVVNANLMKYSQNANLRWSFVELAEASINFLNSICIGRKEGEMLRSTMAIFLNVFSAIIRSLMTASDLRKLEVLTNGIQMDDGDHNNIASNERKNFEKALELLSIDLSKVLCNMSYLRVKLIDFAPHVISSYIKDIQVAPCPDAVRQNIEEGIFRIFNLVDAYQGDKLEEVKSAGIQRKTHAAKASGSLFAMIHSRLDQASREILQDLHDNYNKFHKYTAKF